MNSTVLRTSIWLANFIIITQVVSLFFLLGSYYYSAYSLNDLVVLEFLDTNMSSYEKSWMPKVKLVLLTIANISGIYVFWLIRKLLIHIRQYGPFEDKTIKLLDKMIKWLIVYGVLKVLGVFLIDLIGGKLQISLNTSGLVILLLIATAYILADIFKYGREIRNEQKLTI